MNLDLKLDPVQKEEKEQEEKKLTLREKEDLKQEEIFKRNIEDKYNRIAIDNINQLQKMSFTEIKNLKISSCYGSIFDNALKEAFKIEKEKSVSISKITFSINYKTNVQILVNFDLF
jgi:hypothetical protein